MEYAKALSLNLRKYYILTFFDGFIFAYAIERIFRVERGLSVTQMVYLDIIFFVLMLALEVPTGALADRWSRKKTLILSRFFALFEFVFPIFAWSFWTFALASVAAAFGVALKSGTANALIYDSLKEIKDEKKFEMFLGRQRFIHYLANGSAIMIGAAIGHYINLTAAYWLSLFSIPIAFIIAFTLKEPRIHTTTGEVKFWQHILDAGKFIAHHKVVRFVVLYGVVAGAIVTETDEYAQLYYAAVGLPVLFFGVLTPIWLLLQGIGGFLAPYLKNRFRFDHILAFVLLCSALFLLIATTTRTLWSLAPLLIAFFTLGLISPLVSGYIHHRADSSHRATVESFQSLLTNASSIIVGLVFAYFSDHYSIFVGYATLAAILLVYFVYFVIRKPQGLIDS